MYKIFAVVTLLAAANAAPADQATSFASYNDNHNSVHHIQSAPAAPSYYNAPAPIKYSAPAAPSYYSAPAPIKYSSAPVASSYFSAPASSAPIYAAPVAKVAVPVVAKYAAPVAVTKYAAPVAVAKYAPVPAYNAHEEHYAPAQYQFAYSVQDHHTGDFHSQEEHRDGDHVQGQYSLHEADGTVRIVKYSDDGHGFNAVVEKQGQPTEAPVYKKLVAVAAPHYQH